MILLGKENIPSDGAFIVPNSLDFFDMLEMKNIFSSEEITWLCEENVALNDPMRNYLSEKGVTTLCFSCDDDDPRALAEKLNDYRTKGKFLIYVPGAVSARAGEVSHVLPKNLNHLCSMGMPILPMAVSKPLSYPHSTTKNAQHDETIFSIAPIIKADEVSPPRWHEAVLAASERAFSSRAFLDGSLAVAILHGLMERGASRAYFDGTDDSKVPFEKILAAALAFSVLIKKRTKKRRVAIVLPPGKGGMIANLAVLFAGKVPVNLNFTAGREALEHSIEQADVDKFISADAFVKKVSSFPWPPEKEMIYIEKELPRIKGKIIKWVLLTKILSASAIARKLSLHRFKGDDEAVLLFTSGSSGTPKGVPLSHRNILANVCQFGNRLNLNKQAKPLACLPLFHSFGSTVTLWYPCIEGVDIVSYPSPLETKRLADLVEMHSVNMLLSTPTFLRGYMRHVEPDKLKSLRYVITGAEKLPESLAQAFLKKFNQLPIEGYGLTETSPVTNVNLPDPEAQGDAPILPSTKKGTVGKLLPGIAAVITDPDSDVLRPLNQAGSIWLKGANVFSGYLNDPKKSAEVIKDGWFNTGDIGRIDRDGFLHIEGRLSRFSKIGGEMVPHETIEEAIIKALELEEETERKIAVLGVPDEKKGEAIVLLSALRENQPEKQGIDLRYKLIDQGIPALWCPKKIISVSSIPVLPSGKLDLESCKQLSQEDN